MSRLDPHNPKLHTETAVGVECCEIPWLVQELSSYILFRATAFR